MEGLGEDLRGAKAALDWAAFPVLVVGHTPPHITLSMFKQRHCGSTASSNQFSIGI